MLPPGFWKGQGFIRAVEGFQIDSALAAEVNALWSVS
jgi:hypothetical protein